GIVMQQLHYPAELRPIAEVGIEDSDVKEGELQLAIQLVKQGAVKTFQPDKYHDEVRERIEALISKKLEGEDITKLPEATPQAQVIDLMTALKASLGAAPASGEPGPSERSGPSERRGPKAASDPGGVTTEDEEVAQS